MELIDLQDLAEMAAAAQGDIQKIYLHWTAGHYANAYTDYHLNITGDGRIYASGRDLTEFREHTWHRNTNAVGISICCCADAVAYADGSIDFGPEPPTQQQLNTLAQAVAVLCRGLELPIDAEHVLTHAEAADLDDYGPATTFERWDLWKLPDTDGNLCDGGDLIRSKTLAYLQQ